MSASFYADLPSHDRFDALADPAAYAEVPEDWTVVVTDVKGSTAAVAEGRYRAVNYAGASSIAAVLNAAGEHDVPFVFGGDGATLLVPAPLLPTVTAALRAVRRVVADGLDLDLRVGLVPVRELYARGARLAVLKHRVSDSYDQAMFAGGGLHLAETLVKGPATADRYDAGEGDVWDDPERRLLTGLECRWREVESPHGETISLLVMARGADVEAQLATYRRVLAAVEAAYGGVEALHPITLDRLRLARSPGHFAVEAAVRAAPGRRRGYRLRTAAQGLLGRVLIRLGARTAETDWARYPRLLRDATDFRKFDDTLRMVVSGDPAQRARLVEALEREHAAGALAYGVHVSDRATLTCLVFSRMGRQVHFVDGAGGGYTAAAVGLKRQLAAFSAPGDAA